ncbi:Transketolase, N-terminal section [Candidatus Syntrophocurvum alkaliphilum]|uniref:Transketolase, N-terminal section n=1 Tax=Candidatus Syntrophocurvum alkaliphilum TaxID=2293317 RepID=A0A6I6DCJ8_9FIRM|nr:transketolase [Candidatus Syntrophocurvum alkaliphilum]QGU00385.1 Transketolase, N-terminal section [Candidatus Syntrophocurvum alkaliphilum]
MREINDTSISLVKEKARLIRRDIIEMLGQAGSGHTGGSLSAADIVSCLYFWEMNIDAKNPMWENRDRFILSKGHAAPVLYSVLAQKGFFPSEQLKNLRKLGSPLQGHPDMKKLPGVEASTGSLGQGISWAVGMALAGKIDKKDYRVYTLLGDGEIQEGMVWEACMAASHYKLENLTAFVDYNGLQIDGPINEVMSPEPIAEKFRAFGWHVIGIDGHKYERIMEALNTSRDNKGKPTAIIANTIKGKGCSFMENKADWHGVAPKKEEVEKALEELMA